MSRFQCKERLGSRQSSVFKGHDRILERDVAMKRFRIADNLSWKFWQKNRFRRDYLKFAALSHPNVVRILEFTEDRHGLYAIQEFVDGVTLAEFVEKHRLTEAQFFQVAEQLLDALVAIEQQGLKHIRLDPDHIMIVRMPSGQYQVKILDSGLWNLPNQKKRARTESIFPPNSMMIERSHLYAVGCVLFHSLTGRFPGESDRTFAEMRPDLPAALGSWLLSMTARTPERRPKDSLTALAQLQQCRSAKQSEIQPLSVRHGFRGHVQSRPVPLRAVYCGVLLPMLMALVGSLLSEIFSVGAELPEKLEAVPPAEIFKDQ